MWIQHLFRFLGTVLSAFVGAIGTSYLGLLAAIAFAVAVLGATLWRIDQQHGREAMKAHWKEDAKIAWRVSVICAAVIYGPIFLFCVVKAIYIDHQYLVGAARKEVRLLQQNKDQCAVQVTQLDIDKAGLVGTNSTLQNQNRDQQGTINNCQTQAIKLLTPTDLRVHTAVIGYLATDKDLANDPVHPISMLILTNKPIATTKVTISCNAAFEVVKESVVGSAVTQFSQWNGKDSPTEFTVGISSPQWTPMAPLLITIRNQKEPFNLSCGVVQELP
jgi:hypothetical protein